MIDIEFRAVGCSSAAALAATIVVANEAIPKAYPNW
jgi:hypothetical protein